MQNTECYRNFFMFNNEIKNCHEFNEQILHHGKSLYEVLRIKQGIPLFFEKYMNRLKNSSILENVSVWISDQQIKENIYNLISLNKIDEDSIKIVFSFNNEFDGKKQNIFLLYFMRNDAPTNEQFQKGVFTISHKAERLNPHAKVINVKFRTDANKRIKENLAYEAILIDRSGFVTEGSRSNIFFIKDNEVFTPLLESVLPGITRHNVIHVCNLLGLKIFEEKICYNDVSQFDSAFITGTSRKVLPLNSLDNINFSVENQTLRKIMNGYDNYVQRYISENKY